MKKYDVIIIGCGPSGVAAAKILKQSNVCFCIIDKNKFPREKLCGGGITHKTTSLLKDLALSLDIIINKSSKDIDLFANNINKTISITHDIVMIDRLEFDYNNLKQVINDNLFEKEEIISIEDNILTTNKDRYHFKYILFADGVNGYSRKLIDDREFGFCVEYSSDIKTDKTVLDFCAIESGYGWIFPKATHTTIGIGKFNNKKVDYQNLLCDFAQKHGFPIDKTRIRGYHIPVFSREIYKKSVIDNQYILVGDAASLVDQVSGEGIYYALASGKAAAESIITCIKEERELNKIYFEKTRNIYKKLIKRKALSKLLYSRYEDLFIKIGLSNKYFINYIERLFG